MPEQQDEQYEVEEFSVEEAMKIFNRAEQKRKEIEDEFEPILEMIEDARSKAKQAQQDLALAMKRVGRKRALDQDYRVVLISPKRRIYHLDKLPQYVQDIPGVVKKTVDKDVLERAIEYGTVDERDVLEAIDEVETKPYVRVDERDDQE